MHCCDGNFVMTGGQSLVFPGGLDTLAEVIPLIDPVTCGATFVGKSTNMCWAHVTTVACQSSVVCTLCTPMIMVLEHPQYHEF